ncbi:MAG: DNA methylase, partial [Oscillospiraceae bacterium]
MAQERTYIAIDLKSFYASVECVERGLDPLTTNLVVADASRTEKTICLAVSPSLKACGIPGRARLFEVIQKVGEMNARRRQAAPGRRFTGASFDAVELKADPALAIDYIAAPPRMAHYIACSTKVYGVYLKYVAPEDIHVYSIDEVFMDVTAYLKTYRLTARALAREIVRDVFQTTGITATAGIGTNLYLCKVAMDIVAKRVEPDADGVRIAQLDEQSYRKQLWEHRPLTDFWRVGRGYARKLEANGMYTMGDVARCSLGGPGDYLNEDLLYKLFGVNAELLIDHAWGWEPCTMADIKAYRPSTNSLGSGQVLQCPYTFKKAKLIVREMTDLLVLDLVDKGLVTDQMVLTVG